MKIAILGFGREGRAVYKFLKKHRDYKNAEVWVLDKNSSLHFAGPEMAGIKKQLGGNYLKNINRFDLIFRSPGVSYQKLMRSLAPLRVTRDDRVISVTKLFLELCPCPVIGVTGTKGKGTTATLLYNILKKCGRDVQLAGNIGKPALDILPRLLLPRFAGDHNDRIVVLELSSFQLQDLRQSPAIAIVLNIFPDHLDVHKDLREYYSAKANIARFQRAGDSVFYFADDKKSAWIANKSPGKKISIQRTLSQKDGEQLRKNLKLPGSHNWRNAQAAFAVARHLNCPKSKIFQAVAEFKGNEHRMELVKIIRRVKFYNDSASTNPLTTLAAVKSFKEPKILIAGGSDKGLDYKMWAKEFPRLKVKTVVLFGANKYKIKQVIGKKLTTSDVVSLEEAIKLAKKLAVAGDVVLFSPGAASFDMFKDYADRGKKFKNLVKKLKLV